MRLRLVFAALIAAASLPLDAHAQAWLSDSRFSEGIGIRVGDLELHPGIGAEFGYDSNYFQRADSEKERNFVGPVVDVLRLRVTPSLSLGTLGDVRRGNAPPGMIFRFTAFAAYNELFAVDSEHSDEVRDQRHVTLGVNALANIGPHRPIGVDLHGSAHRIGEPSNLPEDEFAWDRWTFNTGLGLTWRPGGGLFEWRAGYDLTYNYFEEDLYDPFHNLHHQFGLRGRWRFLPRTALLYDGSYTLIRYTTDDSPPDGEVVRTRLGIRGLVTYRLALTGSIGWMSSFYEGVPENQDTITAQAEAKYFLMPPPDSENPSAVTGISSVAVGYSREMSNSYLNSFYTRDRGYLGFSYFLGNAFVASLRGGFSHYSFPQGARFQAFSQNRVDAGLFAEYRLSNTIGLNGSVRYDTTMSDDLRVRDTSIDPDERAALEEDLDFVRWQAFIGLRWFM